MLFENYQSYQPVFEILFICLISGIIGYLFHYVISRKKWHLRFQGYENRMRYYDDRLRELDELKDKQGLLFKNDKDMTLKINELDALLGLDGKVNSITKTLNSLNFVSSKEFNSFVNEFNEEYAEYKVEQDARFNALDFDKQFNDFQDTINKIYETQNEDFVQKFNQLDESYVAKFETSEKDFNDKLNEMNSKFEPTIVNHTNSLASIEERLNKNEWQEHLHDLSTTLVSNHESFLSFKERFDHYEKWTSKIEDFESKNEQFKESLEQLSGFEKNLISLEERLSENSQNKEHFDKINNNLDHLNTNYKSFKSSLLKHEETLEELSSNQDNFKKEILENQSKAKELFSKVISYDENFENYHSEINSLKESLNDHSHGEYSTDQLIKEFNKLSLQLENHTHDEYNYDHLTKEFEVITSQLNASKNNSMTSDYESYFKELRATQDKFLEENQVQDKKLDYLSKYVEELKSAPKPKEEAKSKVKVKSKKRKKLVDNLSIKNIKVTSKDKDDLKLIKGVGPFIEKKINKLGIYTFEQVSHLNKSDIELITDAIEFFPGRIARDNWKGQAKKLYNKKRKAS